MSSPSKIRNGLSIVEVLTSIVVAMIGVFGVMVLIPFAVKQAQTGLDSDAAVSTARDAYSQFEIAGMRFPGNWVTTTNLADTSGPRTVGVYDAFNRTIELDGNAGLEPDARIFSIDPLGVMEQKSSAGTLGAGITVADMDAATFPFLRNDIVGTYPNGSTTPFHDLRIPSATLLDAEGSGFTLEMARRMCKAGNDLVYGEDAGDLVGPNQLYDQDATGNLRRQNEGRISWSAIVVPFKSEVGGTPGVYTDRWSYRMYILVYKNRKFLNETRDSAGDVAIEGGNMNAALLETAPGFNDGLQSPLGNVFLPLGASAPVVLTGGVKRDDWVMLINRFRNVIDEASIQPAGVTYAEKGFDKQVAFCRVVNFADEDGGNRASITLDGPDFDFGDSTLSPFGTTAPERVILETYVVHLKDVVGVYERTFSPELESAWNISQ